MRIQIDTELKTIRLEQSAKITELLDVVKKLLPENEWKKYTLETNVVINNWSNPIYIDRYIPYTYPGWTITSGSATICTTSEVNASSMPEGTAHSYCFEIN